MARAASPFATTDLKGGSATSSYYKPQMNWASQVSGGGSPAAVGGTGVNPLDLRSSINDLLGFQGKELEYSAAAEGARMTAEGARLEAEAYSRASGIAEESAKTEGLIEAVRQVQIATQVDQTVGDIKASVAGSGFQQSGSAIDLIASSMRQGYLSQQISQYQSVQTQRGYLEQSAAAQGEMAAAQARQASSTALAEQYDKASGAAVANATALSGALAKLLEGDENAQQLTSDLLAGNTENLAADVLLYNPAGEDKPLATSEVSPAPTANYGRFTAPT